MNGQHIDKKLKALQVTKKDLADKMGVAPQSVSSFVNSKAVGTDTLEKICAAVDQPITFFYEGYQDNEFLPKTGFEEYVLITGEEDDKQLSCKLVAVIDKMREELKEKDETIQSLYRQLLKKENDRFEEDGLQRVSG